MVLLCLVGLALADDSYYYPSPPCYGRPGCHGHSGGNVFYRYHINYPKYGARQVSESACTAQRTQKGGDEVQTDVSTESVIKQKLHV